jgi:hypothetical protein
MQVFLAMNFDEQVDVIAIKGVVIDFDFKLLRDFAKQFGNYGFISLAS